MEVKDLSLQEYLSWVSFNKRVIDEASKPLPLEERMAFIGIANKNLAEFVQVRYPRVWWSDEMSNTLAETLAKHYKALRSPLRKIIKEYGVVKHIENATPKDLKNLKSVFRKSIAPAIRPIQYRKKDSPAVNNGLYVVVATKHKKSAKVVYIEVPKRLGRFINGYLIEDVIINFISEIIPGKVNYASAFITHMSDNTNDKEGDGSVDSREYAKRILKRRTFSDVSMVEIRECSSKMGALEKVVSQMTKVNDRTLIVKSRYIGMSDILDDSPMKYKGENKRRKFSPSDTFPKDNLFGYIKESDRLAFHPFESFKGSFIRFLNEAAGDSKVVSISITLYRVGTRSEISKALLRAASNGIVVNVILELKARFDESNNLQVAEELIDGGVNVIYTNPATKAHCKLCVIARKESKGVRLYSHVGTGNYHEANSKIYTDYSLFTAKPEVCHDLARFFNIMTSESLEFSSDDIMYSPHTTNRDLLALIETEIKHAKKGKDCGIVVKCNALTDAVMADALVNAANKGVPVTCIVRSQCIITPMENLTIISVVGRFLEHSRVYKFGPKGKDVVYIGSADMMSRNLHHRNELLVKITDPHIHKRISKHLQLYRKDTVNRRIIQEGHKYALPESKKVIDCHEAFINEALELI